MALNKPIFIQLSYVHSVFDTIGSSDAIILPIPVDSADQINLKLNDTADFWADKLIRFCTDITFRSEPRQASSFLKTTNIRRGVTIPVAIHGSYFTSIGQVLLI